MTSMSKFVAIEIDSNKKDFDIVKKKQSYSDLLHASTHWLFNFSQKNFLRW